MRVSHLLTNGVAILFFLTRPASCQTPPPDQTSPQFKKDWVLGQKAAHDLEQGDGRITDQAILEYLRSNEDRIATGIGARSAEVRVTRSVKQYASLLPNGVLYISGGLLQRMESEAELAGLLAHELAHVQAEAHPPSEASFWRGCVLDSPTGNDDARAREQGATGAAYGYLKSAGYDPTAVLDLFSKLAYEHPAWATAIVPKDLLAMREKIDGEVIPDGGYRLDSSEFLKMRARLEVLLSSQVSGKPLQSSPGPAR